MRCEKTGISYSAIISTLVKTVHTAYFKKYVVMSAMPTTATQVSKTARQIQGACFNSMK